MSVTPERFPRLGVQGAALATGELLLFTDADTWMQPDLIAAASTAAGYDVSPLLRPWLETAEAPQLDPAIDAWVDDHLPDIMAATDAAGHPNGPYVSHVSRSDPAAGMIWDVSQPRYSSGYFPLRNRASILIEMHAHKPYRDRVLANRVFMEELIEEVEGATVTLVERDLTVEAQPDGAFRFEGLSAGSYTLTARAPGFSLYYRR